MSVTEWFRRIWYLLNRRRFERALQQEMEAHRELMGEPKRFGNTLRLREEARDVWRWNWLDDLWRNFKYGIRGLRREPTFTLTATFTLALGVATTTTVFSVADAELWKPLPFPQPHQLVAVYSRGTGSRATIDAISGADLLDWRAATPGFSDLAAIGRTGRQVLQLKTAESVRVSEVTGNYFATLGRQAIAGRIPSTTDLRESRVAILTDRGWRRLFSADPSWIGRALTLDEATVVIAGVVPSNDSLGDDPDLFLTLDETAAGFLARAKPSFNAFIGRLRPGVDAVVARAQLQAVETRLVQTVARSRAGHNLVVEDLSEYYSGNNWRPLYFFIGASLLVLLLSVVNVATLLLARAFRRTREFALRGALGGGQLALARQLLVEGALIAIAGSVVGAMLTSWAVQFFTAQLPADFLARGSSIPIDVRVWAFIVLITALMTAGFVLTPLFSLRRFDLSSSLKPGSRTGPSAAEGRVRGRLLTAQIALTVVLLCGAGIFLKSFMALTNVPLGFDPVNAIAIRASLSGPRYASDTAVRAYADQLVEGARGIAGVRRAAIASSSPLGSGPLVTFTVADSPNSGSVETRAIIRAISPAYFETLGIRILQGREFTAGDVAGAPRVAVVNESLVRARFGAENPLGRVIDLLPARAPWTNRPGPLLIVGVASNVKEVGINEVDFADIYVPFAQVPAPSIEMIVRAATSQPDVRERLRQQAALVDPAVPVTSLTTFEGRVADALQGDRFNLLLIAGFAVAAVLLAAVGIYGSVAYNVQARTRELGVRLALGAHPRTLVAAALWQAGRFGIVGGGLGLTVALVLAVSVGDALYLVPGSHNGLLYGVSTTDPVMLAAAFLGIVLIAIVAGALPARRVARVDPVLALRSE